jgi:predicted N-acyltransferase
VTALRARFLTSIEDIDASAWNSLSGTEQPFLRHEFLHALEASGCATPRTGWAARHLVLDDSTGKVVGAMPLYLKSHSRGEFVFDFSWANAYAQHGKQYYPKLLTAVPFTPVQGPRLLVAQGADPGTVRSALARTAMGHARAEGLSSWHVLFPDAATLSPLRDIGLIERRDCQFHWFNQGYESFDAFLATFTAEKRKKAKRERRRVAEAGIEFDTRMGGDMDDRLWQLVYEFYADTFYRHGHEPYLSLDFFKRICAALPSQIMLKIARHGGSPIAVAIFFVGHDALFGRYWGAGGNYHSLHFETCYYQGIEYCIEHRLKRFEPGTQGEHKIARGFEPALTWSAHWIGDSVLRRAISSYLEREGDAIDAYAAAADAHAPFRKSEADAAGLS